jgi:hypothetical protein
MCRFRSAWKSVPVVSGGMALVFGAAFFIAAAADAQDIPIGATYVCSGEHIYIENCNIRDTSDTSTCMVAHPDKLLPNGMNSYTYATRGALKKLLPTCIQPSAKQAVAAKAFQQKQQDIYNANVAKSEAQMKAPAQAAGQGYPGNGSQIAPPKNAEERAMRRCVSSGRLPASCTGNQLLGAFTQMIGSVLPGADKPGGPAAGANMAGVFEGAGNWRLDFIDGGVLVNCAFLSPNQEAYSLRFESNRTMLTINTRPRPLVLTFHADGTITGPGPVTIDGVVAAGYVAGKTATQKAPLKDNAGNYYDSAGNRVHDDPGYTNFAPRTASCPALNLSSKGASVGMQTMQTDLLKSMFSGDKGPPTPPGIRMHGIFAASTGFSLEFFPESVIVGCGPDSGRAYPYVVEASGSGAVVKVNAPDHPLALAYRADGSLDPGSSGAYQVHGRIVTGQDQNDDFTFAPMEQTCNLAVLSPSKQIPMSGGIAATTTAAAAAPGSASYNNGGILSTPQAPLGNATLSIVSGLPAQSGMPNPLAGRPFLLLRWSYADSLQRGGVTVPAGMSAYKYAGSACGTNSPDCPKLKAAMNASTISAVRADANGAGTFPGVPPGTYYLMISAVYNQQPYVWGQAVQVHAGSNTLALDLRSATSLK